MAETLKIEIPIETIDKTEPELSNLVKKLAKAGEAAEKAGSSTEKAGKKVSKFDESAEKTQRSLAKWAREKYEILLEAKEKISPILAAIGRGLKSVAGKTWRVTMRAADFVTAPVRGIFNLLRNPLLQAGAVLGVSFGMKDTIDTYKSFEAAMSKVQAVSGAVGSDMDKLTKKAEEMGNKTKFSATESAEALNYMAMAGWKTEDMLNGIEGIMYLAGASGEDLATTSDIVTDAITAFGMTAGEASHFADVLAVASSNANTNVSMMGETFKYVGAASGALGYSVDDAALAIGLMANSGIKASQAGTELNSIFTRLATNTNGAKSEIEKLGINFFDSSGKARAFSDVLVEMRSATKHMTEEEKINFANTVAGTRAQAGLLAMLNATAKDFNKLQGAIEDANGASLDMYNTMQDNLQGSLDSLSSKMESVKLSFGKRLAPYIRDFAEWLGNQMPALSEGLDEFMDFTDQKLDKVKKKFEDMTAGSEWQNADFFGKVKIAWDEFIAEPFSEWWNGKGKAKVAGIAADIGSGLGSGLKHGIMALFGIDLSDTVDEASSIGSSFARGFSEGFDFDLIKSKLWEGLKNLVSDAGKLLPGGESAGLSSVISAALLAKIASPFISLGGGAFNIGRTLFGSSAGGTSLVGGILGSTGNAMVSGSGLLGSMADVGYSLTGGAATSTLSGSTAALAGTASTAGVIAAGATLISGAIDTYKAVKSDDEHESNIYGASAAMKVGGVGMGAVIGTMILPGVGTAIGAGIGGIAGYIAGNKVKESYEEELEEAEKAAANAQKVFEATGLSIDEVEFKNKALAQAMNDSEVSAEQFAQMFQEDCANVMKEAFGDVHLSLTEVKALAEKITFGDMKEGLEEFNTAAANTDSALSALKNSMADLKKENWRMNLGKVVSESDVDNYKQSVSGFAKAAKQYIEDVHYESANALKLLRGDSAYTRGIDIYYGSLGTEIDSLSQQLDKALSAALEDGVISTEKIRLHDGTLQLSEAEEIESLQNQIAEITGKVASARNEAEFDVIGVKYSGAALDVESFAAMQEEMKAYVESASETYENALASTLSDLKLRRQEGKITQGQYDTMAQQAAEGYQAQIRELSIQVQSFNMDTIAEAFGNELDGILPNLEGDLSERMKQAMDKAFSVQPDVEAWTREDVKKWFGLDKLDATTFEDIFSELKQSAAAVPQMIRSALFEETQGSKVTLSMDKWLNMNIRNTETEMPMLSMDKWLDMNVRGTEFSGVGAAVCSGIGEAIMNADMTEIKDSVDTLKTNTDNYVNTAFSSGTTATMPINIIPQYNMPDLPAGISAFGTGNGTSKIPLDEFANSKGAKTGGNSATEGKAPGYHAAGGFVTGKQLSWLAEEGYGEFVIPTNPSRRTRALELYEQAGSMLGVGAHEAGGYVGGSRDSFLSENDFKDKEMAFYAQGEGTEENGGNGAVSYDFGSSGGIDQAGNNMPVQINVNMAPKINIQTSEGGNGENIAETVKGYILEMVDELGGEIDSRLMDVFSNMPMEGA